MFNILISISNYRGNAQRTEPSRGRERRKLSLLDNTQQMLRLVLKHK